MGSEMCIRDSPKPSRYSFQGTNICTVWIPSGQVAQASSVSIALMRLHRLKAGPGPLSPRLQRSSPSSQVPCRQTRGAAAVRKDYRLMQNRQRNFYSVPVRLTASVRQAPVKVQTSSHLNLPVISQGVLMTGHHALRQSIQAFYRTTWRHPIFRLGHPDFQQNQIRIVQSVRKPGLDPRCP